MMQETQLPPYRRNMQDLLCDSSMIPYPEPYQTIFQKRRLGAFGLEWCPSSIMFATGPDISLGQDYQMPVLEDLDRMLEPLSDVMDAFYWEPENQVISDDTESEYNVTDECTSEGEHAGLYYSSPSDPDCSTEDSGVEHSQKDGPRRSRRKNHKIEVELMASGRHVKKRNLEECNSLASRNNGAKKSKCHQKISKRTSSKAKSSRPQRIAARNAISTLSRITRTSSDSDSDSEDDSEDHTSNSESVMQDSFVQSSKSDRFLQNLQEKSKKQDKHVPVKVDENTRPHEVSVPQLFNGNGKKLVLKFSLGGLKKPVPQEDKIFNVENKSVFMTLPLITGQESRVNIQSSDPETSSANVGIFPISQDQNGTNWTGAGNPEELGNHEGESASDSGSKIEKQEVRNHTTKLSRLVDIMPGDASIGFSASFDDHKDHKTHFSGDNGQFRADALHSDDGARIEELVPVSKIHGSSPLDSSELLDFQSKCSASAAFTLSEGKKDLSGSDNCRNCDTLGVSELAVSNPSQPLKDNPPTRSMRLRIKTKTILPDGRRNSELNLTRPVDDVTSNRGGAMSENPLDPGQKRILMAPERGKVSGRSVFWNDFLKKEMPLNETADFEGPHGSKEYASKSVKIKASSLEPNAISHNLRVKVGHDWERKSEKLGDGVLSEGRMSSLNMTSRSRSSRNRRANYSNNDMRTLVGSKPNQPPRNLSWLMLLKHEEAYHYIPQLGDEVVYLIQGHQEYAASIGLQEESLSSIKGYVSAVEICKVESLDYATAPSGDSCCKIKLRFIDPLSDACRKSLELTLPDLVNFPDFVVEKTRYDAAISRNWTNGQECLVWWRNADGEDGSWWEGKIVSSQAKSDKFTDSPWEKYLVQYGTAPPENRHSPWELHDPHIPWEHPHIDLEIREKLLSSIAKLELAVTRNQDKYGVQKLNEASLKLDFLNRFPVPLYPEVIRSRLENNYYRTLDAVEHDISVMMENAQSYFVRNAELSNKMRRLSDWFTRKLASL
uniref:Uncharacterized protein MANES_01G227500 n=1 Tax=Rhizophora mucronata TaxID=61149 RepID=A0A2P2M735_RHIMU